MSSSHSSFEDPIYNPEKTFVCASYFGEKDNFGHHLYQELIGKIAEQHKYTVKYLGHPYYNSKERATVNNCRKYLEMGCAYFLLMGHTQAPAKSVTGIIVDAEKKINRDDDDAFEPKHFAGCNTKYLQLVFLNACEVFDNEKDDSFRKAMRDYNVPAAIGSVSHVSLANTCCELRRFWENVLGGKKSLTEAFDALNERTKDKAGEYGMEPKPR